MNNKILRNKICPNCHNVNSADHYCCTECGTNLIDVPIQNDGQSDTVNTTSTRFGVLGVLAGAALIVTGIVFLFHVDDIKFGADFYTEIYKLVAICARSFSIMLITSGIALWIFLANHQKK